MRDGHKVFDTDTHVSASCEELDPYLSPRLRELVPDLEAHRFEVKIGFAGEINEPPFRHRYRLGARIAGWGESDPRVLGEAAPRHQERHFQHFMGVRFPTDGGHELAAPRLKDMDEEGVDVQLLVPDGANGAENSEVEFEMIAAQHRWLEDLTSAAPGRLKSILIASARSVEQSVAEIHRYASSSWARGVQVYMPLDYPVDHPDLAPIFHAAEDEGLAIVHHSFASGYPGYRDMWDNPFLGRTASHPWAAARFVGAVVGAGMFDRYPKLRFGILESGFGWLPHWAVRMDDQLIYVGYCDENLKEKPSDYLKSGRFFCSIEMHEGPEMVRMFTELLGDDILMIGTDYPHAESRFPQSVDRVLAWKDKGISETTIRKILWDNPTRYFGEP
jgi:predicted TIM-barrel fold metal-dependent hydrolase